MRFEPGKEYVLRAEAPITALGVEAGDLVHVDVTQPRPVTVLKSHGLAAASELLRHSQALTTVSPGAASAPPTTRGHLTLLP